MMKLTYKQLIKLSLCTALAVGIITIPINSEARFRGGSVEDHSVIRTLENELEYIKNLVNRFAYDNPVEAIEEQIGNYKAVFTREALAKSEEYNQKLAEKTDLSVLDRITQLLNHSTTIVNNAIKVTGTVNDTGTMGASQKETILEATEAEQKIDSTSIKINKTTSDLVNENTKSESQRGIQKAVPYFSDPEDSDVKKKRNEELEKMGIHNHKLPSFSND